MNKKTIIIYVWAVVTLLSGCASYPRYTVEKGSEGGPAMFFTNYQEKRHVDPTLAEDEREWLRGWPHPATGKCVVLREDKDKISSIWNPPEHPINRHKADPDCAIWDATDKRAFRYLFK